MMESKVFADNFSRSFSESGDFFQFLSARQARSKWMTAPSKELRFEPVERGSTLGNLYMQIYDHNGDADVLEDTMENTSLLLKVDGKDYPVRSCALKTVLERARISGHALNKVSKSVFAEILNYCMGVASGDSLIKVADEKVSAVHGGDPKDYTVMEMLPLFKATNDFLDREYPGNRFMTAHFDHSIATAIWRLNGQADKLLDTYHREIAAKGLRADKLVPALRFSTSDVGMSGANLYPIFLAGAESRIIPLGYPVRTEHKNGSGMEYFEEQLGLVYAQFEKAVDKQVQLMNIEIRYPVTTAVLETVFRQASNSRIITNAYAINHNDTHLQFGDDFQFLEVQNSEEAAQLVIKNYLQEVSLHGIEDVQILSPLRKRGAVAANALNETIRDLVNPPNNLKKEVKCGSRVFRVGDRIMQTANRINVSNGDVGVITDMKKEDDETITCVRLLDGRTLQYTQEMLEDLEFSYCTTIHKSQGQEYPVIIVPLLKEHYIMLRRNLLYTAVTRAKAKVILIGQKQAVFVAIHKCDVGQRNTVLADRIVAYYNRELSRRVA